MSREDRRRQERKEKKTNSKKVEAFRWVTSLPKEKAMLVESYAKLIAEKHQKYFTGALERSYSAAVITELEYLSWSKICDIIDTFDQLVTEDVEKMKLLNDQCGGDLDMAAKKINEQEQKVRDRAQVLIEEGKKQKEIIEILQEDFPKLSKSMLTNAYKRVKTSIKQKNDEELIKNIEKAKELETKVKNIKTEDDVVEAVNYILGEEEKIVEETIVVPAIEVPAEKPDTDFEIIKEVRILDLKGKFGEYHIEKNVVEIKDGQNTLSFQNENEVRDWADTEKESIFKEIEKLNKLISKITDKENETIKVINKFL